MQYCHILAVLEQITFVCSESTSPLIGNCLCDDDHIPGYNFGSLELIDQYITLRGSYDSFKKMLVLVDFFPLTSEYVLWY